MSFYGEDCVYRFLERIPDKTLAIAHNLSYDISFLIDALTTIYQNPIIKNGRVLMLQAVYQGNHITFKDSYAIITKHLKSFPEMFQLDSGRKEVFPYNYYNSINTQSNYGDINEALKFIPNCDKEQFLNNLQELKCIKDDKFDMIRYCEYYNEQDVRILKQGFEKFRSLLLQEFNLDAYNFVSISSIAN